MKILIIYSICLLSCLVSCNLNSNNTEQSKVVLADTILKDQSANQSNLDEDYNEPEIVFKSLNYTDEQEWIMALNKLPVPEKTVEGASIDKNLSVYYRYNKPVNGYTVTCRFFPYYKEECESGYLIARFHKENSEFIHREYKRTNAHTDHIRNWKNNEVYEFNYIEPRKYNPEKEENFNTPLGYDTPFQFFDIDFDGEQELMVNDFYKGQCGNYYHAYKVYDNKLIPLPDYPPYSMIDNLTHIDPRTSTLVIKSFSGCSYSLRLVFKRNHNKQECLHEAPVFADEITKKIVDELLYVKSDFSLDSIRECKFDSIYYYVRKGSIIKKVNPK